MADDLRYVPGEFYRICDRTGFKVRAPNTQKEWTNRIVRDKSWEKRQPQDFVQGVADDQSADDPRSRPFATAALDLSIGPVVTSISVAALAGATSIQVASIVGIASGNILNIVLDDKSTQFVQVTGAPAGSTINITSRLRYSAAIGNQVTDCSVTTSASL